MDFGELLQPIEALVFAYRRDRHSPSVFVLQEAIASDDSTLDETYSALTLTTQNRRTRCIPIGSYSAPFSFSD